MVGIIMFPDTEMKAASKDLLIYMRAIWHPLSCNYAFWMQNYRKKWPSPQEALLMCSTVPRQFVRPLKPFCRFGKLIIRIIMLPCTAMRIVCLTTVIFARTFTLNNVHPKCHCSCRKAKRPNQSWSGLDFSMAPRDGLEPPTKWLTATRSTNWATEDQVFASRLCG